VFWLVLDPSEASVCVKDPGFDIDVHVTADSREFHRVFAGRTTLADAVAAGTVTVDGPRVLVRQLPSWFAWSLFYDANRAHLST
jgi:hypothetical protein